MTRLPLILAWLTVGVWIAATVRVATSPDADMTLIALAITTISVAVAYKITKELRSARCPQLEGVKQDRAAHDLTVTAHPPYNWNKHTKGNGNKAKASRPIERAHKMMNTIEDFDNAPVGATATRADGYRAMKIDYYEGPRWLAKNGLYLDEEGMASSGYTLDPIGPPPVSAREALDLAWELAYPVKEGQIIPGGTQYLEFNGHRMQEHTSKLDHKISPERAPKVRTLEPLPDPDPDWLGAPAVLARVDDRNLQEIAVFTPTDTHNRWTRDGTEWTFHWKELRDVTPLYPKGQDA